MSQPAHPRAEVRRNTLTPAFMLYASSQLVSWVGDSIDRLAIPWLVQELTGSPAALGAISATMGVAELAVTPFAGVWVDRSDRLRLSASIDLFSGLMVGLLALLTGVHLIRPWHLFVGLGLLSGVRAAYGPAQMALVPALVPPEGLQRANALTGGLGQAVGIIGPGLAGVLLAAAGYAGGMGADAASFLVSAAILFGVWLMRSQTAAALPAAGGRSAMLAGIAEGGRYIARQPVIRALVISFALTNLGTGPLMVLLPTFLKELDLGPAAMAAIMTGGAVGGLVGSVASGVIPAFSRKGCTVALSLLACSLLYAGMALSRSSLSLSVLMAALSAAGAWVQVYVNVIFQQVVPAEVRGRVFAVRIFVGRSLWPLGAAAAGLLAAWTGVTAVLVSGATLGVIASLGLLLVPPVRDLKL